MKYPADPILIVDDERDFLDIARIALQLDGINNTAVCSDSRKVRTLLRENSFSLVLLDLSMPHVSGSEILRHINETRPELPVIVITACTEFDTAAGCVGKGAWDYLIKPVDKSRLTDAIRRVLEMRTPNGGRLIRDLLLSERFNTSREVNCPSSGSCCCTLLKKTRAAYKALFSGIHVPVLIATASDLVLRYCNERLALLLGFPEAGSLLERGSSLLDFFDEPDRKRAAEELLRTGSISNAELHGRNAKGEEFWALVNARIGEGGEYVDGTVVDITHKKRLEEQLLHSRKMEALGRMAGGVAHDFSNILAVINGHAQMLLTEPGLPAVVESGLREIQKAYRQAARMARQLLSFGRKQPPAPRPLHLQRLVEQARQMLLGLMRKDVTLHLNLSAEEDLVRLGTGQFEQVLANLLLNAQDAMPQGGRIEIDTRSVSIGSEPSAQCGELSPGAYLLVRVSDTGCGMDKMTQQKIFEPFFTTKAEGQGTGLGLFTVFGIVKSCGGAVFVDSEPGRGSRFEIYFPLAGQGSLEQTAVSEPPAGD